jgi:hypothetical protein
MAPGGPFAHWAWAVGLCWAFTKTLVRYFNARRIDQGIRRLDVGGKVLTNRLQEQISFRQLNMADEPYVVSRCFFCFFTCSGKEKYF